MESYLERGLWGLMRAARVNQMTGHLGAALLAGELLKRERPDLEPGVGAGIDGELQRIVAGEESWFSPTTVGLTVPDLFEPAEDGDVVPDAVSRIATALAETLDDFHESGHNVIFAALAMRAIRHAPEGATKPVVAGIVDLTRRFAGTRGGRGYYGKRQGWRIGDADPALPASAMASYETLAEMTATVLAEVFAARKMHRRGYGGVVHVVNHAAALLDLAHLGYPELAQRGLPAHRLHFARWRWLPDLAEEFGASTAAPCDPRTGPFWGEELRRDTARLTHRIKGMYGFLTLLDTVADAGEMARGEEVLRYLVWS